MDSVVRVVSLVYETADCTPLTLCYLSLLCLGHCWWTTTATAAQARCSAAALSAAVSLLLLSLCSLSAALSLCSLCCSLSLLSLSQLLFLCCSLCCSLSLSTALSLSAALCSSLCSSLCCSPCCCEHSSTRKQYVEVSAEFRGRNRVSAPS